jgi:glutathione S-transferase
MLATSRLSSTQLREAPLLTRIAVTSPAHSTTIEWLQSKVPHHPVNAMVMEPLTLISATPSSFARMNHVALSLKGILFKVHNEIPWESKTVTPQHNPLEQLPVLIFPDGRSPIYNSAYIQTYIVEKYADHGPLLLPGNPDENLPAKQIAALSVGSQDEVVLAGWEMRRKEEMQSQK